MQVLRARSSSKLREIQFRSSDAAECVEITSAGRVNDRRWQRRRRRFAVPLADLPLAIEIIAQGLLVEARLSATRRVRIRRPEPRAVRREHFVDEDHLARAIMPELELGIRD